MSHPTVQADWYDHPLYYDIIFDEDTQHEVNFLEAMSAKHQGLAVGTSLQILEPACGSGRLVSALAQRGHTVHGFDLNPKMLAFAQERLVDSSHQVSLWEDRMEKFAVPKLNHYDVAHCFVSTFKYLLTEEHALSHLRHVHSALKPGGLYLLGFHLSDYPNGSAQHERWTGSRDGIDVVCNTHTYPPDKKTRLEKLRTRLKITRDGKTWTQETHWQFRTYSRAQAKKLLQSVPEFELLDCYPFTYELDAAFPISKAHYDTVFVLKKR